jgi:hypothetical protein
MATKKAGKKKAAAAAQQRFVEDLQTRDEAAPLKGGRLALGKTHIQKGKTVTRARFTLTG